ASVAAGRLDDDRVFFKQATFLSILDHRHADPILDAAERIKIFALEQNRRRHALGDSVQSDQGCAADGFDNVVIDASHRKLWLVFGFARGTCREDLYRKQALSFEGCPASAFWYVPRTSTQFHENKGTNYNHRSLSDNLFFRNGQ